MPLGVRIARAAPAPFRVSIVDCPWQFNDKLPGETRGAENQYPTLTVDDLAAKAGFTFEFPSLADDHVMFFWRVASMQLEAFHVLGEWGFTVKSEIIWRKLTKDGKPWFGMGRYARNEHEVCLIAARGKAASQVVTGHSVRSVFEAPVPTYAADDPKVLRGEVKAGAYVHSGKPEEFVTNVVLPMCAQGPYVELFGRRKRAGWTVLGNEVEQ